MNNKHSKKISPIAGFTLIELMIVTAVLSIMLLVLYQIWMSNERATQMLDAEIKMRDEARLGFSTMIRNLRMAEFDPATPNTSIQYIDGNDVSQPWPPPDNATFARGVVFRRPVDLEGDGNPYSGTAIAPDWSGVLTYRVDTNDINGDGDTNQVVQLLNGAFIRILIDDVAPPSRNSDGTIYDTPAVGGFWLRAPDVTDPRLIQLSVVQQRNLVTVPGFVVNYYEDFVRVRN